MLSLLKILQKLLLKEFFFQIIHGQNIYGTNKRVLS